MASDKKKKNNMRISNIYEKKIEKYKNISLVFPKCRSLFQTDDILLEHTSSKSNIGFRGSSNVRRSNITLWILMMQDCFPETNKNYNRIIQSYE